MFKMHKFVEFSVCPCVEPQCLEHFLRAAMALDSTQNSQCRHSREYVQNKGFYANELTNEQNFHKAHKAVICLPAVVVTGIYSLRNMASSNSKALLALFGRKSSNLQLCSKLLKSLSKRFCPSARPPRLQS